jgi:DNA-binding NtrC family response regulator
LDSPVIAVINDDPDYLEMMEEMLESERDCQVVIGQKGEDALDVIKSASPDLVILDIIMGNEPMGVEILEAVRADASVNQVPVIICSADSSFLNGNAERMQELDCVWLEKPFDLDDILTLIDQKIGVHSSGSPEARSGV